MSLVNLKRSNPYVKNNYICWTNQVVIAQWLALWLATGEVLGSNPGKGENLLLSDKRKFNDSNLNTIIVWVYELIGLV